MSRGEIRAVFVGRAISDWFIAGTDHISAGVFARMRDARATKHLRMVPVCRECLGREFRCICISSRLKLFTNLPGTYCLTGNGNAAAHF